MRVKNIFAGIMMALMLVCIPFAAATGQSDVPVVAGESVSVDMTSTSEDLAASDTLGGLMSTIQNTDTFQRWVKVGGVNAWLDETITVTDVQDFTTYMFPVGATIDPEQLTEGAVFQTSESIDINGVTGVWTTNECSTPGDVGADVQTPATPALGGSVADITLTNGVGVQWDGTSITAGDVARIVIRDNIPAGYTANGAHEILACDANCPSEVEVEAAFGGDWTVMSYLQDTYGDDPVTYTMVAGQQDGVDKVFADMNGDGVFEIMDEVTNGYQVDSITGQSLALIPAASYDIYGLY